MITANYKPSVVAGCSPRSAPQSRAIELERVHRFTHDWEAAASLRLRHGDLRALDAYESHGRIIPGTFDEHLDAIAERVDATPRRRRDGRDHGRDQRPRRRDQPHDPPTRARTGDTDTTTIASIADGVVAVGDIVATRRNHRQSAHHQR